MSSTEHPIPSTTTPEGEPTVPTRWHPCAICDNPEGTHHSWPFVCCSACLDGLEDALDRAYEEFRAQRRKEISA